MADVKKLIAALKDKAKKYKDAVCIARTHGVHAEPTTFGLKMAIWFDEMNRNLERLQAAVEGMRFGKLSGAVGTYANIDPSVEEYVCQQLNLKPANVATQIISVIRMRIMSWSWLLSVLRWKSLPLKSALFKKRNFWKWKSRSLRVRSVHPPCLTSVILSTCERICGLSRILRANSMVALENMNLWHERDISHSSAERVILPDSTIALNYMLNKFIPIIEGLLGVSKEHDRQSLQDTWAYLFPAHLVGIDEKGSHP